VSIQVLAVLLIWLVVLARRISWGTFLGLAGAGLTGLLKDFMWIPGMVPVEWENGILLG